ncbi:MAG: hypothetical protein R3B57_10595 [Phycisphaerales bacterium]
MPLMTRTFVASLVLGSITLTPALAQEPLLEIHCAGLDAWSSSPKDAAAMGAIHLLGDRLGELEHELDMLPEEGELIRLGWDVLTGEMALRVQMTDDEAGFAVALSSRPLDAGAASLRDRLLALATASGMPFEADDAGGALFGTPMGPASLRVVGEGDAAMTCLTMGETDPASLDVPRYDLPAGATPFFSMRADLATITGMLFPFLQMQDPTVAQAVGGSGWVGPDAPTIQAAAGFTDDALLSVTRIINAKAAMSSSGIDPETVFMPAHLRAAPEDTVRLYAFPFTLESLVAQFEAVVGADVLGELSEEFGVDVRAQIVDNLGPRMLVYQSDSTGGGGLLSSILVAELADADAFIDAHAKLVDKFNAVAADEANGYLRIASREHNGVEVYTLTTPGLPIPLELSWAVAHGTLVVGASPTSLEGALAQLDNPAHSVLENPLFQQAVGGMMPAAGASSITFADTPRLARRGYGMTSLLTSAIANGTRSPISPDRVTTSLMPPFASFVEGVRPSGTVASWEGDDYVVRMSADRSFLVLVASATASLSDVQGLIAPAVGAGMALPALARARESARQVKSATLVRAVMQGVIIYGANHNDAMPESFDVLIDEGIITPEMLVSPFGPASDGGQDIAVWFALPGEQAFAYEADQIVAIDRAMLLETGYLTSVGFADNHVELLSTWELEDYLNMPKNDGAREALGIPDL